MLKANSSVDLTDCLSKLDIEVPPRSEGRTTEQVERYAFAYLLSTLNERGKVSFPFSAAQEDRPDFVVKNGTTEIGIEHTEAVSQNEAHKAVLRDRHGDSGVHFLAHASTSDRRKSAKKLLQEIEADEPSEGWVGDSVEKEWAEVMLHFSEIKMAKLSSPGFRRFQENWLLIYDNWHLPAVNRSLGSKYLYQHLLDKNLLLKFNRVFVLSGEKICEFSLDRFNVYKVKEI